MGSETTRVRMRGSEAEFASPSDAPVLIELAREYPYGLTNAELSEAVGEDGKMVNGRLRRLRDAGLVQLHAGHWYANQGTRVAYELFWMGG